MIKKTLLAITLLFIGSMSFVMISPQTALADACGDKGKILTIKPWYYGLTVGTPPDCQIKPIGKSKEDQSRFIWTVGLNIAEMLLQLSAYVAVGFVLYGGFLFMTSGGSPDKAAAGRKTAMSALIGMVIAIFAVVLVNLVARTALGIG